ncbi:hypothetical protein ABES02_28380 [Neobacillus pocheonensis]
MEQVCTVCGERKGKSEKGEINVLIICEACLDSEDLHPYLDKIL